MRNKNIKLISVSLILILILLVSLLSCGVKFDFAASVSNWDKTNTKSANETVSGNFKIDLGKGSIDTEVPFTGNIERTYDADKGTFKLKFNIGKITNAKIMNIILAQVPKQISADEINSHIEDPSQAFEYDLDLGGFKFEHLSNFSIEAEIESLTRLANNDDEIVLTIKGINITVGNEFNNNIKFSQGSTVYSFREFAEYELAKLKNKQFTWKEVKDQKLETLLSYFSKMMGYDLSKLTSKHASTLIKKGQIEISEQKEIREVSGESEMLAMIKIALKLPGLQQMITAVVNKMGLGGETLETIRNKLNEYLKPGILYISNFETEGKKAEEMKINKIATSQIVRGIVDGKKVKDFVFEQIDKAGNEIDENTKATIKNIINQQIGNTLEINVGGKIEAQYKY